jgi:hypothetical protein
MNEIDFDFLLEILPSKLIFSTIISALVALVVGGIIGALSESL